MLLWDADQTKQYWRTQKQKQVQAIPYRKTYNFSGVCCFDNVRVFCGDRTYDLEMYNERLWSGNNWIYTQK